MKLSSAIITVSLAIFASAACTKPIVRREWNTLSLDEQRNYMKAATVIANRPMSYQYKDPSLIAGDDFTFTHAYNVNWAHRNQEFFLFHRAMIKKYELALQTAGWTGGLVYFDEGAYPLDWANSSAVNLFTGSSFGTLTEPGKCIFDGQFVNITGIADISNPGNKVCITRSGDPSQPLVSGATVARVALARKNLVDFQGDDTIGYHGLGHLTMGGPAGTLSDRSYSPRDPLFYLHHGYIDKIYWKWQNLCPEYLTDYEGQLGDGSRVNASRPLDSWSEWSPNDIFDTKNDLLCYTYTESIGDVTFQRDPCANGAAPNFKPYAAYGTVHKRSMEYNRVVRDRTESYYTANLAADNTTLVQVTCGNNTISYTVPTGCEVHSYFCTHLSIKPFGYVHVWDSHEIPDLSTCPSVLYPPCDIIPSYERPAHLKPPTVANKYQYPTFMTDDQVFENGMDLCSIRAGDNAIMLAVDEFNAGI